MLNWLQEILGEAYTAEIDEKVRMEIGKGFVSKTDFTAKSEAVRELSQKLTEKEEELSRLKEVDVDGMRQEIDSLKGTLAEVSQDGILKEALSGYRFSSDYARDGVFRDLKARGFSGETTPEDIQVAIEELVTQKPEAFFREDFPRFSRSEAGKTQETGMQFHFTAVK